MSPDLSTRDAILACIRHTPGACVQEIADDVGIARTSATYHLRVLGNRGDILQVRKGRRLHHYPPQVQEPVHRSLLATVRLGLARRLVQELHQDPRASWRRLAGRLGVTRRAIRWHVRRMQDEGILDIQTESHGRHIAVFDPRIQAWLQQEAVTVEIEGMEPHPTHRA